VKGKGGGRYLLLTECAMGDNIASEMHGGELLRMCSVRCPHMNEITLENVRDSLIHFRERIELDEDLRVRAKRSIDRMLEIR
jgi:quinolinate synthase